MKQFFPSRNDILDNVDLSLTSAQQTSDTSTYNLVLMYLRTNTRIPLPQDLRSRFQLPSVKNTVAYKSPSIESLSVSSIESCPCHVTSSIEHPNAKFDRVGPQPGAVWCFRTLMNKNVSFPTGGDTLINSLSRKILYHYTGKLLVQQLFFCSCRRRWDVRRSARTVLFGDFFDFIS